MITLAPDFKEFLRLLNSEKIEYLLIGGYAVGYYGYPRATGDLDIWIALNPLNAARMTAALEKFGFGGTGVSEGLFLEPGKVIRMGVPPVRIELLTTISAVEFADCYRRRTVTTLDGIEINLISIADLRTNKQASGRLKDLNDLEHLP